MSKVPVVIPEEEQRAFQALAWNLHPDASWDAIREAASVKGYGAFYFDFEDWLETITRLYGSVFEDP